MLVRLSGKFILVKLLHPENVPLSILVRLSGSFILVKLLHPENAPAPMLVRLSGKFMLVNLTHPENVPAPMLVKLSGNLTLVTYISMPPYQKYSPPPIRVTFIPSISSGITISPDKSHPIILTDSPSSLIS